MLLYEFRYTDDYRVIRTFNTVEDMQWFAHNEGDHLLDVKQIDTQEKHYGYRLRPTLPDA